MEKTESARANEQLIGPGESSHYGLEFETFLATLSAHFINLPVARIDSEIEDAQRRVCEFLHLDCSVLWQRCHEGSKAAHITHSFQTSGATPSIEQMRSRDFFPWAEQKVLGGETVIISKMTDLPPEAGCDMESFRRYGTSAVVVVPLSVGGQLIFGWLTFALTREERNWSKRIVDGFRLIGHVFANALARKKAEESLEERLRFEIMLSYISARFVNLPSNQVDSEIEDALGCVCECLGLDLAAMWRWSMEAPGSFTLSHIYRAIKDPPIPKLMKAQEHFPWCLQQVEALRIIAFSSLEELPVEAVHDQETFRYFGIKSALVFPLRVGDGLTIGAMNFNTVRGERTWPEMIVKRLQLVAEVFVNALARKRMEDELRENEMRLSMATTAAGAGLWSLNLDTARLWVTPKTRELYDLKPDVELSLGSFYELMHSEDREGFQQSLNGAIQLDDYLSCEHRIVLPDGRIRWIMCLGRFFPKTHDLPDRVMGVSIEITKRKDMECSLREQLEEINRLKLKLEQENLHLRGEIIIQQRHGEIVSRSSAMNEILNQAEQVAGTDATVLLQGETGTGKELIARIVHNLSSRKDRPMVTVNCASLPPALIENELFGREKGAYTGAMTRMAGRFELADRSTLFLDEIGELPLDVQAKLLRVLEEKRFERLGSNKSLRVDVRIIAATNRDLAQEVAAGKFRQDLYYRLTVFPIFIPPLRERPEDIHPLVWAFVKQYEKKMGKRVHGISQRTMVDLLRYPWPGNVRELRNIVENAMITSSGAKLHLRLPDWKSDVTFSRVSLEEVERAHILSVLAKTDWRIAGKYGAAELLGLKRTTLLSKIKKLGIKRPPS